MGCCASRSDELMQLEKELKFLKIENNKLTVLVTEKSESEKEVNDTEPSLVQSLISELNNVIDKDQLFTTKVLNSLQSLTFFNSATTETLLKNISQMLVLTGIEKIIKYGDIRFEESEFQSQMCSKIEESIKRLFQRENTKKLIRGLMS